MTTHMKPLNGNNTRPLSQYAVNELLRIAQSPVPKLTVNAGVVDRLLREDLVEIVQLPSPYKVDKGGNCSHLRITETGKTQCQKES